MATRNGRRRNRAGGLIGIKSVWSEESRVHPVFWTFRSSDEPGKRMFEIRIHGRGGQGVVTAAELLSVAAFLEGKHAQAFPSFGSERTGAPVVSFCRIDDKEIRLREPIRQPDALIVQDPTLFKAVADVFHGVKPSSYLLINTNKSFAELHLTDIVTKLSAGHVCTVPASELALKHIGRPLPNAALLGAFPAL